MLILWKIFKKKALKLSYGTGKLVLQPRVTSKGIPGKPKLPRASVLLRTRYPQILLGFPACSLWEALHTEISKTALKFPKLESINYMELNAELSINQGFYPLPFSTSFQQASGALTR